MEFFKEVNNVKMTSDDVVKGDGKVFYMSEIGVDKEGKFVNGVCVLESNNELMNSLTAAIGSRAFKDAVGNGESLAELENAFRTYVLSMLEDGDFKESLRVTVEQKCYSEGFDTVQQFILDMQRFVYHLRDSEEMKLLWSGAYKYIVYSAGTSKNEVYISVTKALEKKAHIEHECCDTHTGFWWQKVLSEFRRINSDPTWLYVKEQIESVGKWLQTTIVKPEDFHENPIHYMMGPCYDGDLVEKRTGSDVVQHIIELGFLFSDNQLYNILLKINKILGMKDEFDKISDEIVKSCAVFVFNMISQYNKNITEHVEIFDKYYMLKTVMDRM